MQHRARTALTAASLIGGVWLIWFSSLVLKKGAEARSQPEVTVFIEAHQIYAPESLIAFCKANDLAPMTHDQLKEKLEAAGLKSSWFGLIEFHHSDLGLAKKRPAIFRLDQETESMHILTVDGLLILAGAPRKYPNHDFTTAKIVHIPEGRMTEDPFNVLADLEEAER